MTAPSPEALRPPRAAATWQAQRAPPGATQSPSLRAGGGLIPGRGSPPCKWTVAVGHLEGPRGLPGGGASAGPELWVGGRRAAEGHASCGRNYSAQQPPLSPSCTGGGAGRRRGRFKLPGWSERRAQRRRWRSAARSPPAVSLRAQGRRAGQAPLSEGGRGSEAQSRYSLGSGAAPGWLPLGLRRRPGPLLSPGTAGRRSPLEPRPPGRAGRTLSGQRSGRGSRAGKGRQASGLRGLAGRGLLPDRPGVGSAGPGDSDKARLFGAFGLR